MLDVRVSYPHKPAGSYDVVVCAIGYESRARHAASSFGLRGRTQLAFAFDDRRTHAFEDNLRWFQEAGFECYSGNDAEFSAAFEKELVAAASMMPTVDIAVDISSFNRVRLATIIKLCRRLTSDTVTFNIHFYYSLAQFSAPIDAPISNTHVGPVIPEFAGWTEDPMLPPYAVIGLGYEQGKALGALDHLELSDSIAFIPESPVSEYYHSVLEANSDLLSDVETRHAVRYSVHDPVLTFGMLESTVDALRRTWNPILLPFGPKVFFVNSLLVALVHPECSVWRVSGGDSEPAVDRRPSGHVIHFRASLLHGDRDSVGSRTDDQVAGCANC